MAITRYLAMTAAEIDTAHTLPPGLGYMACHFSPYSTGLSNIPRQLPPGSMLILTDRTPIHGHDPSLIAQQLTLAMEELGCDRLLLDLQRPDVEETRQLVRHLAAALPVLPGVSSPYAEGLNCPVLVPPVPPDVAITDHLAPWQGLEIWLEASLAPLRLILTSRGLVRESPCLPNTQSPIHQDPALHCHYTIHLTPDSAQFTLWRTAEDLTALLTEAESLGVTMAVGLYQELATCP